MVTKVTKLKIKPENPTAHNLPCRYYLNTAEAKTKEIVLISVFNSGDYYQKYVLF